MVTVNCSKTICLLMQVCAYYEYEVRWPQPSKPTTQTTASPRTLSAHDYSAFTNQRVKAAHAARIEHQALARRVVQHKHAAKAARLAHLLHLVSKICLTFTSRRRASLPARTTQRISKSASTSMVPWPIRPSAAISPPVWASLISSIRRAPWRPNAARVAGEASPPPLPSEYFTSKSSSCHGHSFIIKPFHNKLSFKPTDLAHE